MSSWGCEDGSWYEGTCSTTPGATFQHPITLNVYTVGPSNAPGPIITNVTQTFDIPYRPSADPVNCEDGRWFDTSTTTCFNGLSAVIAFSLPESVVLPDKVIVAVAYNTTHYGDSPIGEGAACFASSGGCGYDSLNVALSAPPSVGTDPVPDDAYLASTWGGAYCDGSLGIGTFRLDAGCWTDYQPAIKVTAPVGPASSADQCKNDGWKVFDNPPFRNQGQCVSYVATGGRH